MKSLHTLLALVLVCIATNVQAKGPRSGGIVGNGAGLVEMNFHYAYMNLPGWIDGCRAEKICTDPLFAEIQEVLRGNRMRKDRLIFKSALAGEENFTTGVNEPSRLAKTELYANSSIIINVDELYSPSGHALLGLPEVAAVLVHEVGHQTGEPNHDELNVLAGKIRNYLTRTTQVLEFDVGPNSETVRMSIIKQNRPFPVSSINFSWGNRFSRDLSPIIANLLYCSRPEDSLTGFELYNGSFSPNFNSDFNSGHANDGASIGFNLWLKVHCFNETNGSSFTERTLLKMRLTADDQVSVSSTHR